MSQPNEFFTPEQIIAALQSSAGIVSAAAMKLNCTSQTVRNYMDRYPEVAEAREQIREDNLDLAETKLLKNMKDGKEASVFFFLKTQGKHRGYIEGREIQGPNGGPVQTANVTQDRFEAAMASLTDEEREAMRPLLEKMAASAG